MPQIQEVLPKYLQIAGHLRDQIVRGDLPPGAEVPSEREIAATWGVARPTASKALQALKQQGLVEARHGSGTYVREQETAPRARERYDRARQLGTMYSPGESVRFLSAEIIAGPDYVTDALGLPRDSEVICRQRLISSEHSGPGELSTSWFDADLADQAPRLLERHRIRGGTGPYIESATGRKLAYCRDKTQARLATTEEAHHLSLLEPSAVLVYWLTVYDSRDRPAQFDVAVYPPDRWAFRQEYPLTP